MDYTISDDAKADLIAIAFDGAMSFGRQRAERYQNTLYEKFNVIASAPEGFRLRTELAPPVRVCPHMAHVIIYDLDESGLVRILRVRHGRENWQSPQP